MSRYCFIMWSVLMLLFLLPDSLRPRNHRFGSEAIAVAPCCRTAAAYRDETAACSRLPFDGIDTICHLTP